MVMLDLPLQVQGKEFTDALIENAKRLKMFLDLVVNPANISKLIHETSSVLVKHVCFE